MHDIRQSKEYAKYLSSIGWTVEKIKDNYFYIKKIWFLTTIKLQRPEEIDNKIISELAKQYKGLVSFVIEPTKQQHVESSMKYGFRSTNPYLPSKTLILDLDKSEEDIFNDFSKDARYSIKKFKDTKSKIQTCDDLDLFCKAWKESVPFGRYLLSYEELTKLKKAFGNNSLFLLSGLPRQSKASAGGIFLVANNTGYYWQAFTSEKARKTLIQYSTVWEGIKWCKSKGAKYFDFEGIYDERFPLKTWKGFTQFKKKFGGIETEFPGAYQKWFVNF